MCVWGGACNHAVRGRSRMTADPRLPTMWGGRGWVKAPTVPRASSARAWCGARKRPPALLAERFLLLGMHITSPATGTSVVLLHARRCRRTRTLTISGRSIFISMLQLCHAPRFSQSFPGPSFPSASTSGKTPATITGGSARSLPNPPQPPSAMCIVRSLADPGQVKLEVSPSLHATAFGAGATLGAHKLAKVEFLSMESYETSMSLAES